jgi:cytochrome c oxidase assembly protein subunit 15
MVMALVIVAVLLYILDKSKNLTHTAVTFKKDKLFKSLLVISLVVTLVQVVLGTEVRQFVDERVKMLGYDNMHLVMDSPIINFYFHRTFSFIVFGLNLWIYLRNRKLNLGFAKATWIMWLLIIEIASGIAMFYFDFPFGMQTVHLVAASALFGIQFYMILESGRKAEQQLA